MTRGCGKSSPLAGEGRPDCRIEADQHCAEPVACIDVPRGDVGSDKTIGAAPPAAVGRGGIGHRSFRGWMRAAHDSLRLIKPKTSIPEL
jgi:hypothetical protein